MCLWFFFFSLKWFAMKTFISIGCFCSLFQNIRRVEFFFVWHTKYFFIIHRKVWFSSPDNEVARRDATLENEMGGLVEKIVHGTRKFMRVWGGYQKLWSYYGIMRARKARRKHYGSVSKCWLLLGRWKDVKNTLYIMCGREKRHDGNFHGFSS